MIIAAVTLIALDFLCQSIRSEGDFFLLNSHADIPPYLAQKTAQVYQDT